MGEAEEEEVRGLLQASRRRRRGSRHMRGLRGSGRGGRGTLPRFTPVPECHMELRTNNGGKSNEVAV